MARFNEALSTLNSEFGLLLRLRFLLVAVFFLAAAQLPLSGTAYAEPDNPKLANDRCLRCHGRENFTRTTESGEERSLHIDAEKFKDSVHGGRDCVSCHQDITKIPHNKGVDRKVGCVKCHQDLYAEGEKEGLKTEQQARLAVVVKQIESYMNSIHARPSIEDQSRTNATCYNCHDAHYITPIDTAYRAENKFKIPSVCGKCHTRELEIYQNSVHGREIRNGNTKAAVCSDCHTAHNIDIPNDTSGRLAITKQCGNCHKEELETYVETYHGQVTRLGYGETAKCYDCHGSHDITRVDNPESKVAPANRLKTCQTCHTNATQGYVTFQPHGNTHDFKKYPIMWIAKKGMIGLLIGTFAFFWLHSALWFYREYKDRKIGKDRPHIRLHDTDLHEGEKYFNRFTIWWRVGHLIGALSIMLLALTGLTVLFSGSAWAPYVMNLLGGPESAGVLHRIGAVGFMGVFFVHLIYFALHIGRNWRTFEWFGPNSLVPNWHDLGDAIAMFRWFFGLGKRPRLDHYTYWEKFDYWAPFWGMTIIGISGVMMWFPAETASFLPGWVFNVATIVHGEEAILAVVFLFTVHFFNNHFRPDKFPLDTTMFTGRVPLDHYRHEHRREYDRLVASGELEKYLVDAPSEPMSFGSSILGGVLIVIGLTLLTLVVLGFLGI